MKIKVSNKQNLEISNTNGHLLAIVNTPVILEYWDGLEEHGSNEAQQAYDTIRQKEKGNCDSQNSERKTLGKVFLEDYFAIDNNAIILKRKFKSIRGNTWSWDPPLVDMTLYPEENLHLKNFAICAAGSFWIKMIWMKMVTKIIFIRND